MKKIKMKKRMATAVALALLTLPLGTTLTLADTVSPTSTTSDTTTVAPPLDTTVPTTTSSTTTDSTTSTTPSSTSDTSTSATDSTTSTTDTNTSATGATTSTTDTTSTTGSDTATTPVVDENGNTVTSENWFMGLIEKIQLLLTSDPVKKAAINKHQALAKLAEAKQLLQEGDSEGAEACLTVYSDKITQAQDFINQVKDPNSEAAKTLAVALSKVNTNNIVVLGNLLDKLPPQAAQKLALNVVRSMEKAVNRLQKEDTATSSDSSTTTSTTPTPTPTTSSDTTATTSTSTSTTTTTTTNPTLPSDTKALEKQAKIALENFKKSLNQSVKPHLDDQDQDQDQENDGDNEHSNQAAQPSNPVPQTPAPQVQTPQTKTTHGTVLPSTPHSTLSVAHPDEKSQKDSDHQGESKEKSSNKENHRD